MDVMVWNPSEDVEMTTFSTIGMSALEMSGAAHRAELHFAIRLVLTSTQVHDVARFLANLACYPFLQSTHFDWWHKVRNPGRIPLFPGAAALLLYPKFVENGWEEVACEEGKVKLLNVVPISAAAADLQSRSSLEKYVWEELGDPLTPW
jgi:hypothetical protein